MEITLLIRITSFNSVQRFVVTDDVVFPQSEAVSLLVRIHWSSRGQEHLSGDNTEGASTAFHFSNQYLSSWSE